MSIRLATVEDIDLVVEMGLKFIQATNYKDYADEDTIRGLATKIINLPNEEGVILIYENHGMLVATVTPFLFGKLKIAADIAWWIDPEHRGQKAGGELMEAFEYWAKLVGCNFVSMASLDDSVGKYYEKKGYVLQERAYTKEI